MPAWRAAYSFRPLGMPIVTRDRKIIAYAEAGFVRVIPC
jgi:hypothetical protein